MRPGVRSCRASGPGRYHGRGRIGDRRSLAAENRGRPDRIPSGLHRPADKGMDGRGRDRQRFAPVPLYGPMGPGEATGAGHVAARRRRRYPRARGRVRIRPRFRSLASSRGRRQHGTARGLFGRHATGRGVEVSGPARALPAARPAQAGARSPAFGRKIGGRKPAPPGTQDAPGHHRPFGKAARERAGRTATTGGSPPAG